MPAEGKQREPLRELEECGPRLSGADEIAQKLNRRRGIERPQIEKRGVSVVCEGVVKYLHIQTGRRGGHLKDRGAPRPVADKRGLEQSGDSARGTRPPFNQRAKPSF